MLLCQENFSCFLFCLPIEFLVSSVAKIFVFLFCLEIKRIIILEDILVELRILVKVI